MTAIDPTDAPDTDRDAKPQWLFSRITTADKRFQVLGHARITPLLRAGAGDNP